MQDPASSAASSLARCPHPRTRSSKPSDLAALRATLFFTADDGIHGRELWKSDGTKRGTVLLKDISSGPSGSGPTYLTTVGRTLFFTASDTIHGRELWKSDGTRHGTVLVKDIKPGPRGQHDGPTYLTAVDGKLLFTADDRAHGTELWKSDGTKRGTVLVKDVGRGRSSSYPSSLTAVGETLFLLAGSTHGTELWKSNGTKAGTVLVKTLNPGGMSNDYDYDPASLTAAGTLLYFTDDDETHGRELWKSNGTKAGTVLVKDIYPGGFDSDGYRYPNESYPSFLATVGGKLYFAATDSTRGRELWSSNGTKAGTLLVKDIRPGTEGDYPLSSSPSYLTALGDKLFFTATDGVHGEELWRSGGSGSSTVLVKDIANGRAAGSPSSLTAVGERLFFTALDGVHGKELWKSDGTGSGTGLVKDISRCAGHYAGLSSLTRARSTLFFAASDSRHGSELWKSNGTKAGTVMVRDINTRRPGARSAAAGSRKAGAP
ncbi:MAG TPA: ELWxxDGT repeat protein [Nocardioides sp.]|uniref:ELWxxDGT repeat protein n=1 Tax=Nocardioides sp. TaxID=35761 RepID=UPI002E30160A|nr:ELWxxDGT repeat protein [Nocardioides sp.]HEX5086971.1 ELWxxDGT repeat protein [Nocardioides sp.]